MSNIALFPLKKNPLVPIFKLILTKQIPLIFTPSGQELINLRNIIPEDFVHLIGRHPQTKDMFNFGMFILIAQMFQRKFKLSEEGILSFSQDIEGKVFDLRPRDANTNEPICPEEKYLFLEGVNVACQVKKHLGKARFFDFLVKHSNHSWFYVQTDDIKNIFSQEQGSYAIRQ